MARLTARPAAIALWLCAAAPAAGAGVADPHVLIELNAAETVAGACRLTLLVQSSHPAPILRAVYEAVLLSPDGGVLRLTLFDVGALPAGRPRARQFDLPDLPCDGLGSVLINGANACDAPDLPEGACDAGLTLRSRIAIGALG